MNILAILGGTSNILLLVVVVAIIIFMVASSIMGRKNKNLEKERRKKEVKQEIKKYIKSVDNRKNIRVEFLKVVSRKGPEYKYRDVFDVVTELYDGKSNKIIAEKAYEIEGVSTKISKKEFQTNWKVNGELDLDVIKHQIALSEGSIQLSKAEKKEQKEKAKIQAKEYKNKSLKDAQNKATKSKSDRKKTGVINNNAKLKAKKFIPRK